MLIAGIGAALIEAGLDQCSSKGWTSVFLVGSPQYYSRFGFRLAREIGINYPGTLDPYLQYLELQPGALEGINGKIGFHPSFDQI